MAAKIFKSIYIGKLVDLSKYKKGKELGRGTFGITFIYTKGKSKFAVKELKSKASTGTNEEIEILQRLKKCSTNNVLCFKQIDFDRNFNVKIITEYLDGSDLGKYYKKMFKGLSFYEYILETVSIVKQTLNGMNYLHSIGIIHRDIKTQNIMVTKNGTVKLIDFGLASVKESSGKVAIRGGTPYYLAYYSTIKNYQPFHEGMVSDMYALMKTFVQSHEMYSPLYILYTINLSFPNNIGNIEKFIEYAIGMVNDGYEKPEYNLFEKIVKFKFNPIKRTKFHNNTIKKLFVSLNAINS